MFKNQNGIRLEIEETLLVQARLYFPRKEIRNRFWEHANRPGMNVERIRTRTRHGIRVHHGMTRSKGQTHP
jgi:hypothetical protein